MVNKEVKSLRYHKKGSLEISIQAIVIVVLAMTILGLGLGFVRGMFKNITSTTEDVSEQVRQRVLDDLVQGDKKISFPKTEVSINAGESSVLTVGIKNKGDSEMQYKVLISLIDVKVTGTPPLPSEVDSWFQYSPTQVYKFDPSEADVRNIRMSVPTTAKKGSYFMNFKVEVDTNPDPVTEVLETYAEKDFFVVVR